MTKFLKWCNITHQNVDISIIKTTISDQTLTNLEQNLINVGLPIPDSAATIILENDERSGKIVTFYRNSRGDSFFLVETEPATSGSPIINQNGGLLGVLSESYIDRAADYSGSLFVNIREIRPLLEN